MLTSISQPNIFLPHHYVLFTSKQNWNQQQNITGLRFFFQLNRSNVKNEPMFEVLIFRNETFPKINKKRLKLLSDIKYRAQNKNSIFNYQTQTKLSGVETSMTLTKTNLTSRVCCQNIIFIGYRVSVFYHFLDENVNFVMFCLACSICFLFCFSFTQRRHETRLST